MKRRSKAGSKSVKVRRPKTATPRRSSQPKAVSKRRFSATTQTDTASLIRERDEALERERATSLGFEQPHVLDRDHRLVRGFFPVQRLAQ